MPELPDITVYLRALEKHVLGQRLLRARMLNAFVLRSVDPAIVSIEGRVISAVRRVGKRIVLAFAGEPGESGAEPSFLVIHLMIAGRLRWRAAGAKPIKGKIALAALEFTDGTLFLTEAGTTRRASITLVRGEGALAAVDRGGLEPLEISLGQFADRLRSENHTVKRALTDPRLFSGIGNAYSDEILHRARLSPVKLTTRLTDEEIAALFEAMRSTLLEWIARLERETGDEFPEKVTAFREEMAVHGRFGLPCPVCGTKVQRIRYADNETNYCARCQTGGKLLADRALSRLLKQDWPRRIEEVE